MCKISHGKEVVNFCVQVDKDRWVTWSRSHSHLSHRGSQSPAILYHKADLSQSQQNFSCLHWLLTVALSQTPDKWRHSTETKQTKASKIKNISTAWLRATHMYFLHSWQDPFLRVQALPFFLSRVSKCHLPSPDSQLSVTLTTAAKLQQQIMSQLCFHHCSEHSVGQKGHFQCWTKIPLTKNCKCTTASPKRVQVSEQQSYVLH